LQAIGLLYRVALPRTTQIKNPMPQSLSKTIFHIVFSTKDRHAWLDAVIRPRMHAYLASVCRDCDCEAYRVGGVADHIHMAARLARTISQAELLEKIKKTSSAWIKSQSTEYGSFYWQVGYGCFSVGWSQLDELIHYIENQEQHHRKQTFQEEYRNLLQKYRVDFDERYVWD
jgi:REP element-mobilizing transposase RayT